MLTVQSGVVNLWDFDRDFDQKKHSCRLICQIVFAQGSEIVDAKYTEGVLLLQHQDRTKFSLVKMGRMKAGNETP